MFEYLGFDGVWRSYQQKVLDNLQHHLSDKKLHIVAAPGAGKTVLGLEVIRRIAKPCLILAPTITIKNQWEDRLKQLFLKKPEIAKDLISTDILSPKTITIATYQGLLAGLCGQREDEDTGRTVVPEADEDKDVADEISFSRLNQKKAKLLIQKLEEQKIDLLCFDEAHHLRKEWWKALDYVMKNLVPSTTLSLTATPPYDVDQNEWNRYQELCGPVDECISIPELVKNGDLCPHQDLIYFAPIRKEESVAQEQYQKDAKRFYLDFMFDSDFAQKALKLLIWTKPEKFLELLFEDPDFYIAFASYINAMHQPIPKAFLKVFDTKQENLPEFNLIRAESFFNKLIFKYRETFPSLSADIDAYHQKALKSHLIFNQKIYLSQNPKMVKAISRSLGKLDAIKAIVAKESQNLKEKLRLVVLADYIKTEAFTSKMEALGVIPIFMNLANMHLKDMAIGVLTGKIIIIPENKKEALKNLIESINVPLKNISFKTVKNFPEYVEVIPKENLKSKIVQLITKLFNLGELNILVGTQALLGEGWDAPSLNSLILSSTVASYMLSNQMRGRAIRIDKTNPDKVSHIWHLVSIRIYNVVDEFMKAVFQKELQNDMGDFEKVRRRFEGYEAPALKAPYEIQNGIERCLGDDLQDIYQKILEKDYLESQTKKMLSYRRSETKKAWQDGLINGTGMGAARLKVGLEVSTKMQLKKNFFYVDGFLSKMMQAGAVSASCVTLFSDKMSGRWNVFVLGCGAATFLTMMIPATIRLIRTGRPEGILKQISMVILETLYEMGAISTTPKMSSLNVKKGDKEYYIAADTLSDRDSAVFIQALSEFLNPIENPRYLLVRKNLTKIGWQQLDYFSVPGIIGLKMKNVLIFKKMWKQRLGSCNVIYTRTIEGHKILLKAQMRAYSNFQKQTKKSNRWE